MISFSNKYKKISANRLYFNMFNRRIKISNELIEVKKSIF